MTSRTSKRYLKFFRAILFGGVLWTFFQPALRVEISGIAGREWSAYQLASGFYKSALKTLSPKKSSAVTLKVDLGFVDFLKKLFPLKKHEPNWKAYAGLVLGGLIPIAFLFAYLGLLVGEIGLWLPFFKKRKILFGAAFLSSSYALAAVLVLHEKAGMLAKESLDQASRGLFGFVGKSFVQQLNLEPAIALLSLPFLAAMIWFNTASKSR